MEEAKKEKAMPSKPKSHKVKQIGKSHTAEIAKNNINAMARQRQKSREYKTYSRAWRAIRADYLARNPLCVSCNQKGLTRPATHLDHKDGDSWNNKESNYQGLCASCHSTKTNKQDGGFGNVKHR